MAVSLALWSARLVNESVTSLLLFFLCVLSGMKLKEEYSRKQRSFLPASQPKANRLRTHSSPMDSAVKSDESVTNGSSNVSGSTNKNDSSTPNIDDHKSSTHSGDRRNRSMSSSNMKQRNNTQDLVVIFAAKIFVVCVCFLIVNVHSLLTLMGLITCPLRIGSLFWALAVATTQTIFVDRIATVYHKSMFEYSKITLRALYAGAIGSNAILVTLWMITNDTQTDRVKGYSKGRVCQVTTKYPIIPALSILSELVIELSALKMFTSPLRELSKMADRMDDQTLKMAHLARKSTVLTYVMVISTILFVSLLIITRSLMFNPPLTAIHCITLLMFPNWFDDWYPSLCFIPIWISDQCCMIPTKNTVKNVISAMRSNSTLRMDDSTEI